MPELPEVETVTRGLRENILHRIIQSVESHYPGTVINMTGKTKLPILGEISQIHRRGKYILIETLKDYILLIHLRMTGKLVYDGICDNEGSHIRATIHLDQGNKVIFDDIRTFGKIKIFRKDGPIPDIQKLGVEPLSILFTPKYLHEKWKKRSAPVKSLLLQQEIIAGLGNIYACEILYRSKIDPLIAGKDLSHKQLTRIVEETRQVLQEAIMMNGTSISDFRSIDDKSGEFQQFLRIYQKKLCPDQHTVRKIKIAGRTTYFCPVCQHM
jgi:formamidopyrimidine-DNA glycosylase